MLLHEVYAITSTNTVFSLTSVWLSSVTAGANSLCSCWWLSFDVMDWDTIIPSMTLLLKLIILLDISSFRTHFSMSCYLVSKLLLLWSSAATSRTDILVFTPPECLRLAHLHFLFKLQGNVSHLRFKGYYKGLHEFSVPTERHKCRKTTEDCEWSLSDNHIFPWKCLENNHGSLPAHVESPQIQTCRLLSRHKSFTFHWWFANVR